MKKWQKQDYFPSEVGEGGVAHFLLSPWALSDWDLQMFDYAKASYKGGLHCSVSWKLQPGSWGQTQGAVIQIGCSVTHHRTDSWLSARPCWELGGSAGSEAEPLP